MGTRSSGIYLCYLPYATPYVVLCKASKVYYRHLTTPRMGEDSQYERKTPIATTHAGGQQYTPRTNCPRCGVRDDSKPAVPGPPSLGAAPLVLAPLAPRSSSFCFRIPTNFFSFFSNFFFNPKKFFRSWDSLPSYLSLAAWFQSYPRIWTNRSTPPRSPSEVRSKSLFSVPQHAIPAYG